MKSQERHHLKQNEFAIQTARVAEVVRANSSQVFVIGGAIVLIALIAGGYFYMRGRADDQASALLGEAMRIQDSQIVPAPTVPGAKQQAGTYSTEQARGDAALAAFQKVIDAYPNDDAGLAARYYTAGIQLSSGKAAEAERLYAEVVANA